MVNADRRGKATALLQPISGVMVSFLNIMKHRGMQCTAGTRLVLRFLSFPYPRAKFRPARGS
jgi:hypothetical protein